MAVAAGLCFVMGIVYYCFTQDTPEETAALRALAGKLRDKKAANGAFWAAFSDYRVWALVRRLRRGLLGIEVTFESTTWRHSISRTVSS